MAAITPSRLLGVSELPNAMRLALLQCLLVFSWALPSALLPVQALEILGDARAVSLFFFGVGFSGLAAALAAPWITYIFGRRFAFWLGMTCLASSAVLLSYPHAGSLIAGAALRAAGHMIIDVAFELIVMEAIPRRAMARFEAARVFFIGIGLIAAPWLGVRLSLEMGDWSTYILVSTTIAAICLYILFGGLLGRNRSAKPRAAPPNVPLFLIRFLKQPRLRLAWLLCFGRASWWTMFFIYVPIYCVETGLGEELGGIILSLASLALLMVPIWGRLGQKIGVRTMLCLGSLATGLTTVGVAAVDAPAVGAGLLILAAVCASMLDAVGNALFLRAVRPLERVEMAAVFFTYRQAAQLVPPGVLGALLSFWALPSVFVASGAGMTALSWFTRYIPRRF